MIVDLCVYQGKLPAALYQIQDKEAQRFIIKCLAPASERLSAKDLLLDPFLSSVEGDLLHTKTMGMNGPILNDLSLEQLKLVDSLPRSNMTITGTLKPKENIIILKVQFSDGNGSPARNIFFPFDIMNDTPIEVAMEMVEELEITDWDPQEIAEMIEAEISILVPHWKNWVSSSRLEPSHSYDYHEDDFDGSHHLYRSSSCSSSVASASGVFLSNDRLQDQDLSDEISSYSSTHSDKASSLSYSPVDDVQGITVCKSKCSKASHQLTRNRSLIDVHSQRLHRSLLEEVHKKRLSKTVGSVENIGFQNPYEISNSQGKGPRHGANNAQIGRDDKRQGKRVADKNACSIGRG
ncbi:unnamed protein product [Amaranthus hypochondriacus]